MLIDWFTVVAQIINFLILIFLLQRFLYRPIVNTIRARQEEIDRHWQEAKQEQKLAEAEINLYQEKQEQLQQQRQQIIAQAQQEGEQEYHRLLQQARQQVEQKQASWEEALAQQRQQFFQDLEEKLTKQISEIARRAFRELADAQLEQQALATFIRRLQTLEPQRRDAIAQYLQQDGDGLIIRSSFPLTAQYREQIVTTLEQEQIYQGNKIQFTTAPELICGLELQTRDYKIPWNLKDYLLSLEQHLSVNSELRT